MPPQLNHTIVSARDPEASAGFLADILGLEPPRRFAHFHIVQTGNGVSLDFIEAEPVEVQHFAFLVSDEEFDEIFGRIRDRGLAYWADPFHHEPGEVNPLFGGRGVYFEDPDGNNLEILTHPYVLD